MVNRANCILMLGVSGLTGCPNSVQLTVVDLLYNLTVTPTTAYANANGTNMGALTATDTAGCPLALLPRITNVTFTVNTVRGKTYSVCS